MPVYTFVSFVLRKVMNCLLYTDLNLHGQQKGNRSYNFIISNGNFGERKKTKTKKTLTQHGIPWFNSLNTLFDI